VIRNLSLSAIALAMLSALPIVTLSGCNTSDSGTEIPNELVGKEYIAGQSAADAEIKLIPVGYLPGSDSGKGILRARTNAEGTFAVRIAVPGLYNIAVAKDDLRSFRDSVSLTGEGQDLGADTLGFPGSLTGRIALQPQHDPRTATVQVLGTTLFVNVGADGSFRLGDLGAGQYRLKLSSIAAGYAPLFNEFSIRIGRNDTLADTLRPFYSGIPVVLGLKAAAAPRGVINLAWHKSSFAKLDYYLVYRDLASAILPSTEPIAKTRDTAFADTLYSLTPKPGQFPYLDSAAYAFHYRVKILDQSDSTGPSFGGADAVTIPPSRQFATGKWERMTAAAAFPARIQPGLAVFKDKLWLFGGMNQSKSYHDLWSSTDGSTWIRITDSIPVPGFDFYDPVVLHDKMWLFGWRRDGNSGGAPISVLYNSADGVAWTLVSDSLLPEPPFYITAYQGGLAGIKGGSFGPAYFTASADGVIWNSLPMPEDFVGTSGSGHVAHAGGFWHIGGKDAFSNVAPPQIWHTLDGTSWAKAADTSELTPRFYHRLVSSGPKLWSIGGESETYTGTSTSPVYLYDQVWSSEDAVHWTLADAHAPFGQRMQPGVAYFKGRIWVVGGQGYGVGTYFNDVWSMEPP
jgi:hypothetical protein